MVCACVLTATALPHAQQPPGQPAFEVASVRPNTSGATNVSVGSRPGGYAGTNVPLRILIVLAHRLRPFQVVGGPGWIDSDRFDITARAPENTEQSQVLPMLRTLLAERFRLVVHTEARDAPIFALVLARADGRLGPQLKASAVECAPPGSKPNQEGPCRMSGTIGSASGSVKATGQPLADLASFLGNNVERVVVDRTGLTGRFDFELTWKSAALRGAAPDGAATALDGPSVFTAVQEQLGLRLEPARGPVDFLVVDSAERPTPD